MITFKYEFSDPAFDYVHDNALGTQNKDEYKVADGLWIKGEPSRI
jgi:hypothetical protein